MDFRWYNDPEVWDFLESHLKQWDTARTRAQRKALVQKISDCWTNDQWLLHGRPEGWDRWTEEKQDQVGCYDVNMCCSSNVVEIAIQYIIVFFTCYIPLRGHAEAVSVHHGNERISPTAYEHRVFDAAQREVFALARKEFADAHRVSEDAEAGSDSV
jgi:hypothetical protein